MNQPRKKKSTTFNNSHFIRNVHVLTVCVYLPYFRDEKKISYVVHYSKREGW